MPEGPHDRSRLDIAEPMPRFAADSVLRRVGSEPVMFFGAQRALLLQLARVEVGAGVDHHSSFRTKPIVRLWGTLDTLVLLVWGTPREATAARDHIHGIHDRVHGNLRSDDVGEAGDVDRPYSAHDPDLLLWVWATLVDTADTVHRRFLGPLTPEAHDALYLDWRTLARLMGIPGSRLPSDRSSFSAWYRQEVNRLQVTPTARYVAGSVLDPPLPFVPRSVKRTYALLAAGQLPPSVRAGYSLAWGAAEQHQFDTVVRQIAVTIAHTPAARRHLPDLYLAVRRAAVALLGVAPGGTRFPVLGRSVTLNRRRGAADLR